MPNIASRRPEPACRSAGAVDGRCRGDAGDAVHGLGEPVRARVRGGRRLGAGPRRHQRDRYDGDRAGGAVRPQHHRHLRDGREMRAGAEARRNCGRQLQHAGLRRGSAPGHGPDRRERRSRHGWRRLPATEPLMPRRGRPARVDRGSERTHGRNPDLRHHAPAADPDGLDASPAIGRIQDDGRRRDRPDRLALCRRRAAEAGDRQRLPLREAAAAHERMEQGGHVGKIVLAVR